MKPKRDTKLMSPARQRQAGFSTLEGKGGLEKQRC